MNKIRGNMKYLLQIQGNEFIDELLDNASRVNIGGDNDIIIHTYLSPALAERCIENGVEFEKDKDIFVDGFLNIDGKHIRILFDNVPKSDAEKNNLPIPNKYPDTYTISEVADILEKTRSYVWLLITQDRIKGYKVGRDFLIKKSEVEYILKNGIRKLKI